MVACGYDQIEGVDFFETYASVLNTKSCRPHRGDFRTLKDSKNRARKIKPLRYQTGGKRLFYRGGGR